MLVDSRVVAGSTAVVAVVVSTEAVAEASMAGAVTGKARSSLN